MSVYPTISLTLNTSPILENMVSLNVECVFTYFPVLTVFTLIPLSLNPQTYMTLICTVIFTVHSLSSISKTLMAYENSMLASSVQPC